MHDWGPFAGYIAAAYGLVWVALLIAAVWVVKWPCKRRGRL